MTLRHPFHYHSAMSGGYAAGEGPGAPAVAVLNREVSVMRGPKAQIVGFWPGKYDADYLRCQLGNYVFADLVSIGDIRLESGGE